MAAPGQKCDVWKVLGLARNPSKKMRLDESFRMVRVPCHLEVVGKSYGQITVWENVMGKWGRNVMDYIFGGIHWTPSKGVVIGRVCVEGTRFKKTDFYRRVLFKMYLDHF